MISLAPHRPELDDRDRAGHDHQSEHDAEAREQPLSDGEIAEEAKASDCRRSQGPASLLNEWCCCRTRYRQARADLRLLSLVRGTPNRVTGRLSGSSSARAREWARSPALTWGARGRIASRPARATAGDRTLEGGAAPRRTMARLRHICFRVEGRPGPLSRLPCRSHRGRGPAGTA